MSTPKRSVTFNEGQPVPPPLSSGRRSSISYPSVQRDVESSDVSSSRLDPSTIKRRGPKSATTTSTSPPATDRSPSIHSYSLHGGGPASSSTSTGRGDGDALSGSKNEIEMKKRKTHAKAVKCLSKPSFDRTTTEIDFLVLALRDLTDFAKLDINRRKELCRIMRYDRMPANTVVFRQGDDGTEWYLLWSGRVSVCVRDKETSEDVCVNVMHGGSSFGEMALMKNEKRSATIVTLESCELLAVEKSSHSRVVIDEENKGNRSKSPSKRYAGLDPLSRVHATTIETLQKPTTHDIHFLMHHLRDVPELMKVEVKRRKDLCRIVNYCEKEAGDIVFKQGDPAHEWYIIWHGSVSVAIKSAETGETRIVKHLTTGQAFGEMALINDEPRSATIIADEKCELLTIEKDLYRRLESMEPAKSSEQLLREQRNHQLALAVLVKTSYERTNDDIEILFNELKNVSALSDLSRNKKMELFRIMQYAKYAPSRVGDAGNTWYIIWSGRVSIHVRNDEGKDVLIKELGFGELALLRDDVRSATIIAETDTELLTVEKVSYLKMIKFLFQMENEEKVTFLSSVPIINTLTTERISKLADLAKIVRLGHGDVLYKEGDGIDALYIVVRGVVEIVRKIALKRYKTRQGHVVYRMMNEVVVEEEQLDSVITESSRYRTGGLSPETKRMLDNITTRTRSLVLQQDSEDDLGDDWTAVERVECVRRVEAGGFVGVLECSDRNAVKRMEGARIAGVADDDGSGSYAAELLKLDVYNYRQYVPPNHRQDLSSSYGHEPLREDQVFDIVQNELKMKKWEKFKSRVVTDTYDYAVKVKRLSGGIFRDPPRPGVKPWRPS